MQAVSESADGFNRQSLMFKRESSGNDDMTSVRSWGCGLKDACSLTTQLTYSRSFFFSVHDTECERRIHFPSRVHLLGGDLLSFSLLIISQRITLQIA